MWCQSTKADLPRRISPLDSSHAVDRLAQLDLSESLIDEPRMLEYRLSRVQAELRRLGCDALITQDPVNTRYATGMRNMQVWAFHSVIRTGFIPAQGPAVVLEYAGSEHLAEGLTTVAEVRPAIPLHFGPGLSQGQRDAKLRWWQDEITTLMKRYCGDGRRIAIDNQVPYLAGQALTDVGFEMAGGYAVMALAQAVKSDDEIRAMARAVDVAEIGIARVEGAIRPGISENALWAELNHANSEFNGEYLDTRLLSSGPRTNPWYQECGTRCIERGDLVALDTDLIGPYGYDADVSRTFICDESLATPRQREMYQIAHEHVYHNIELLKPGVSFRELSERAFEVPQKYREQSIAMNWHGVSLYGGWPTILGRGCFDKTSEDGEVVPGMTLCVESYVGEAGGADGVKLEEQVLVTDTGYRVLSSYSFDPTLLG
jgi:Xaa-Pro dipeptidase